MWRLRIELTSYYGTLVVEQEAPNGDASTRADVFAKATQLLVGLETLRKGESK